MITTDLAAGIDLGTNTALLLVARLEADGRLEVVEDHCFTPRLGEGVARAGTLSPAAIERVLEAMRFFRSRLDALRVPLSRTRIVGTAVLRRASDARAFVERARAETGFSIEIVSGSEEARLGRVAVRAEGAGPETLVVDVGGGSSELSCEQLGLALSIPIGAVVVSELLESSGLPASQRFDALLEIVRREVRAYPQDLARFPVVRPVIALGGTALNLACLAGARPRYDHVWAEGRKVAAPEALRCARLLAELGREARLALPIEASRAEILPSGLACLGAILERIGTDSVSVTGRGLRFGVVRDLLAKETPSPAAERIPENPDSTTPGTN